MSSGLACLCANFDINMASLISDGRSPMWRIHNDPLSTSELDLSRQRLSMPSTEFISNDLSRQTSVAPINRDGVAFNSVDSLISRTIPSSGYTQGHHISAKCESLEWQGKIDKTREFLFHSQAILKQRYERLRELEAMAYAVDVVAVPQAAEYDKIPIHQPIYRVPENTGKLD